MGRKREKKSKYFLNLEKKNPQHIYKKLISNDKEKIDHQKI